MNAFLKMDYLPITVIQSVSLSAREAEVPQPRPESVPLIFPVLPALFLQLPCWPAGQTQKSDRPGST